MIFHTLSDSITEIVLATADETYAGSENTIKVKICQELNCCETPILQGRYERGSLTTFSGKDLGDCEYESIDINLPIEATAIVPSNAPADGWIGTSININYVSGHSAICPLNNTWIDNKGSWAPSSLKVSCSDKGKQNRHLFHKLSLKTFPFITVSDIGVCKEN